LFIGAARAFDEIDLVHQVTMEEDGHLLTVDVGATGYGNDSGQGLSAKGFIRHQ